MGDIRSHLSSFVGELKTLAAKERQHMKARTARGDENDSYCFGAMKAYEECASRLQAILSRA